MEGIMTSQQHYVYTARLNIKLPNSSSSSPGQSSSVQIDLRLTRPGEVGHDNNPIVMELQASDISFESSKTSLAVHPDFLSAHTSQAGPALGQMTIPSTSSPAAEASTSWQSFSFDANAPVMSQFLPSPITQISAASTEPPLNLPQIPSDRLVAPAGRTTAEEALVKECVITALKKANQWSGTRPSPLIQIDRLLTRIELFVRIHRIVHYEKNAPTIPLPNAGPSNAASGDSEMPMVFWNDLLKHGGLATAWTEQKARRAYRHIYADILTHQNNPAIKPFLTSERSKTLDELEVALDVLAGRPPKHQYPATPLASTSKIPSAASTPAPNSSVNGVEIYEDQQLLDLPDVKPQRSGRKRKRDEEQGPEFSADEPLNLPEIPTIRLTRPADRTSEEDEDIKKAIIAALSEASQWSGSRPSVITSMGTLVGRIRLLIELHQKETMGGHAVTWEDLVKHGGIAQSWAHKKAGRNAYKLTYGLLRQYSEDTTIRQLLASPAPVDIKAVENALQSVSQSDTEPQQQQQPVPSTSYLPARDPMQAVIEPSLMSNTSHQTMFTFQANGDGERAEKDSSMPHWEDNTIARSPALPAARPNQSNGMGASDVDELGTDSEQDETLDS